jgi:hypothetical protein
MSRVAWSQCLLPPAGTPVMDRVYEVYEPPLIVTRTLALPAANPEVAALPDRRAYRSLARTGLMLCAVGLAAARHLAAALAADPYRVGIYCAVDPGPQNYEAARLLAGRERREMAALWKQLNHPKRYLSQLANLPAAHLGIFLGIRGPVNVYCHSTDAARHAVEQAELDLAAGTVAAALVCAAFSLEDPLLALRVRMARPDAVVREGAAAAVLEADGGEAAAPAVPVPAAAAPATATAVPAAAARAPTARWQERWHERPAGAACSGIAQPLIDLLQEESASC